jgi:hypothetical protein
MITCSHYRYPLLPILACAILVLSLDSPVLGQSAQASSTPTLQVLSAAYASDTDRIVFSLVNNGQKPVTAYSVNITVSSGGNVIQRFGHGLDMLNAVLNARCQAHSDTTWNGAIKPGGTYTESVLAGLDKARMTDSKPVVQVVVTGIIWSDGSVEGLDQTIMNQYEVLREETLNNEASVISIVNAHQADPDIQHRISEMTKGVSLLKEISPRVKKPQQGAVSTGSRIVESPPVYGELMVNLNNIAHSNMPKEYLEAYTSFFVERSNHRVVLMNSMLLLKPQPIQK